MTVFQDELFQYELGHSSLLVKFTRKKIEVDLLEARTHAILGRYALNIKAQSTCRCDAGEVLLKSVIHFDILGGCS